MLEPHISGLAYEYESGSCELTSCRSCNAKNIADHLIANGVTVQEWISVKDRLPEMEANVLMYFAPDKNMAAGFMCDVDEDRTMWCAYTDGGFYTDCDFEPTHWMPLPEPPKENDYDQL